MLEALTTRRHRIVTAGFLVAGGLGAAPAAVVGVSDNPPGIILALVAAIAFLLAAVHPWRRPGPYLRLFLAAAAGFPIFVVLHNLTEALASRPATPGALRALLQGVSVSSFFLAILACPPALLVGAIGAMVSFLRSRGRPSAPAPAGKERRTRGGERTR